jgi:hypothetical protein
MPRLIVRLIWPSAVFSLSVTLLPLNALADGKRLFMEYSYINSRSETKNKTTGQKTENDFSEITQRYNLDLSKTIYPFLTVRGGGLLELDQSTSTTQDVDTKTRGRITRPFVRFDLNSPLYAAGIGYRKTEIKEKITGVSTTKDFKEDIDANLGWRPAGLPRFDLFFTRTHVFDNLDTVDSTENLMTFNANYTELEDLFLDYTYTRNEGENRISDLDSLQQTHNGRVNYSRGFLDRRLSMDTGLRISQSIDELSTSAGGGTVLSPLFPSAGLFSLDNTPEDGPALASTPALIDGDINASTGIDIGLAGDETTLTNIGLDFGLPVRVDTIFVWVDRSLSSTVADSFSWSVYTSPDNTDASTWTLQATVSPASFGLFQNRFEITFPVVETAFIKVVTRPLSPAVPGASNFPNIFVTEMEGFTTLSVQATGVVTRTENLNVNYNLNLQARASDKTALGYNLFYRFDESDPSSQRRTTLSNGIYVNHTFNRVFIGSARLFRDDWDTTGEEKSVEYTYSASVRAAYSENFGQTLSYSGTHLTEEEGSSHTNSTLLRNSARLYRGWDAFLDAGYSWDRPLGEGRTTSTLVRLGTNLLPNEKISINMNYDARWSRESGEPSRFRQEGDVQAFFSPFRTLSLFARVNVVDEEDDTRSFQNYSLNWSPFPEGALEFFFQYSELLRSEDDREDRIIGPGLRWRIRRGASLELFYNLIDSDSKIERTESKNFSANLRISL